VEQWLARVKDNEGVGTYLRYKFNDQLFRWSIRNMVECRFNECQFVDAAALIATTCIGAEQAALSYVEVVTAFGLTVSLPKTACCASG
jgi:hypothetical protein